MTSRKPSAFRQSDLTRVYKGAAAAGIDVANIEVEISAGRIIVRPISKPQEGSENPWDEVLTR